MTMHVGEFLKKYREHYDLSRQKMADLLGLDSSGKGRLEKWEVQVGSPKEKDAALIKEYFQVSSLDELNKDYLTKLFVEEIPRETPFKNKKQSIPGLEKSHIQERLIAIDAQLRVLFLKIVEIQSEDPKTKVKRSSATVTLELEDLIRQETKRLLDELKQS